MNYLDTLNDAQREAVVNTQGPSMVIAGAGSGKTRVLTFRIAHLIRGGVDPFRIMALTFTNKAAREMQERIANIVGQSEARNIWMGTFHSICCALKAKNWVILRTSRFMTRPIAKACSSRS